MPEIDNIRLALIRAAADIQANTGRPAKSIEIHGHPLLADEEAKRVSNNPYQARQAKLLEPDKDGAYSVTEAGHEYLMRHVKDELETIPTFTSTRTRNAAATVDPHPRVTRGGNGEAKPEGPAHVCRTLNDLEARKLRLEEQTRQIQTTIDTLKKLLLEAP